MPDYVYGCRNKEHKRVEVVHGINDNPDVRCSECGEKMHRIPQPFSHYVNMKAIWDYYDKGWGNWKAKQKAKRKRKKENYPLAGVRGRKTEVFK